jgi:hypothetical protein
MRTETLAIVCSALVLGAAASSSSAQQASGQAAAPPAWYQRFTVRGYVQLRYSDASQGDGPVLDVPADRSVNPNETFVIRRGRVVLSGDVTPRTALYAQIDLAASAASGTYTAQLRDLYADVALDSAKEWRVRVGQSKVPFGWVNMQSSQNRAPLERPDSINSAAEGERDIGAFLMWAPGETREIFRDLVSQGLKGSGDYGVFAAGLYSGQGLNRSDKNGDPHVLLRYSRPFKLASGQFFEVGVQAYSGDFVVSTQPVTVNGVAVTPAAPAGGTTDRRVGISAVWYPQPFGVEMEWNTGEGPLLAPDYQSIEVGDVDGGYVQFMYRRQLQSSAVLTPFARWQHFEGGRKFADNAPPMVVDEWEVGVEYIPRTELELTAVYAHTAERTRTSTFPYAASEGADRIGVQLQWNF